MARCTWDDGRGNWGIKGVELAQLPPNAYGALYKLHDIERMAEAVHAQRDPEHASYLLMDLLEELGLHGEVPHAEA